MLTVAMAGRACETAGAMDLYRPSSYFLYLAMDEHVSFGADAFGRVNLARLIALTRDADGTNRDWATMVLAELSEVSAEIRAALLDRLDDDWQDTKYEALLGLAKRDRAAALPVVRAWLAEEWIASMTLEAAAMVADTSLSPRLDALAARWGDDAFDPWFTKALATARAACASGVPNHRMLDPD